jgi:hypothetical protein
MFLICHFACTRLKLQVFSLVIHGVLDTFALAKLSKLACNALVLFLKILQTFVQLTYTYMFNHLYTWNAP